MTFLYYWFKKKKGEDMETAFCSMALFPNMKQPVFTEHIFRRGMWRSESLSGRLALG